MLLLMCSVYQAFDLFVESANHPTFLRTGLPGIDQALNGGLHCRAVSEVQCYC